MTQAALIGEAVVSLLVTCLVSLTVHLARSSKICTDLQNYHFVERNVRLPNAHVISLSTQGQILCARTCLARRWCKSFNFDIDSGKCELNYLTLSPGGLNATHLVPAAGFVFSDIEHWPEEVAGACANHNCTINTYCEPVGTRRYLCKRYAHPTSCAEVKECDPSSTDGEYWLRIPHFGLYRTRIYCHNMNTSNPVEYITLPSPNYGVYPEVSNFGCTRETPLLFSCVGSGGEWWYMKIRVAIEDMQVVRTDKTFANFTNHEVYYAQAEDCYTSHFGTLSSCGTKGEFTVNLTSTGWLVDPDVEWIAGGWRAIIESVIREGGGSVIRLKCGGFHGYCYPKNKISVVPSFEALPDSSATEVRCSE